MLTWQNLVWIFSYTFATAYSIVRLIINELSTVPCGRFSISLRAAVPPRAVLYQLMRFTALMTASTVCIHIYTSLKMSTIQLLARKPVFLPIMAVHMD